MKKKVIGYAGLDHLGLNSVAAAAAKGYAVVGYHNSSYKISDLKENKISIQEPGLKRMLSKLIWQKYKMIKVLKLALSEVCKC